MLLHRALAAHLTYADAISSFPTRPRSFTDAQARAAIARAEQVQTAYARLAATEPALQSVSLDSFDHARFLVLVPSPTPTVSSTAELTSFVDRIENVLAESASGRRELGSAIAAGFNCSISTSAAGQRVDRVVANRQSLLAQLGSLQTPTQQAGEAARLLRLALQHSIEADIRYRDGFFGAGASGCPLPPNASFTLARQVGPARDRGQATLRGGLQPAGEAASVAAPGRRARSEPASSPDGRRGVCAALACIDRPGLGGARLGGGRCSRWALLLLE